ncbi:MAG: DUF2169 domain-containing protein [Gammaproteobacteria bacterium]|nr:DUF2169 domain-containing protein [Gammaproteobacteria bacterium]
MLQIQNSTPFATSMNLFPNEQAIDTLYVLIRATFNIGQQWTLADKQVPPVVADEYWTEPGESSIKYGSDSHTGKPSSDIIMLGHAYAPNNQEVRQLDVGLSVGQVHKTVRVFGDRQWHNGRIIQPNPFKTMPMIYERAYGGEHIVDGVSVAVEDRNPVGQGFLGQRKIEDMNGMPLPNLEDPNNLITSISQQPTPACFAVSAPHWRPRSGYAGTYDDVWQTQRAPYLPEDFDKRFFNMAHPDLIYPGFLKGGEAVEITNMHPRGTLKFALPHVKLYTIVSMAEHVVQPQLNLETVIIEPNELKLSMVWRATVLCDKKALKINSIKINLTR